MKDEQRRRKVALEWLAVVRQAKVDEKTAAAYLTGVSDLPAWAIESACRQIGYRERGPYEPAWPELGAIRSVAVAKVREQDERKATERLLRAAPEEPVSPERLAEFMKQIRQAIGRKVMP